MDLHEYRDLVRQVAYEQARASTSSFFFDGADRLRLTTFGSVASVVLTLEGRRLTVTGDVVPFVETHTPTSDRTSATSLYHLGAGFLLNVQIRASTGAPRIGQVWAILEVVRGLGTAVQSLALLYQGYITDTARVGWPTSRSRSSVDGPGVLRSITGTDPAANTEISETVPTNARWRPLAIQFDLVTGITGAVQEVSLALDDGTTVFARVPQGTVQDVSLTRTYVFAHHLPRNTLSQVAVFNAPLPRVDLQGGHRLRTITANLGADDNYGAPQLLVEEWIED